MELPAFTVPVPVDRAWDALVEDEQTRQVIEDWQYWHVTC
jgi:hypothetical protein